MRIWIIKMLYRSLSPCEQWKCHDYLKQPVINDILADQCRRIDRNWLRSAAYRETLLNVAIPEEK